MPAKAGIHPPPFLDSGLRRNDGEESLLRVVTIDCVDCEPAVD